MADAPAECAAPRVANGHGLGWRVTAPLNCGEREACGHRS